MLACHIVHVPAEGCPEVQKIPVRIVVGKDKNRACFGIFSAAAESTADRKPYTYQELQYFIKYDVESVHN